MAIQFGAVQFTGTANHLAIGTSEPDDIPARAEPAEQPNIFTARTTLRKEKMHEVYPTFTTTFLQARDVVLPMPCRLGWLMTGSQDAHRSVTARSQITDPRETFFGLRYSIGFQWILVDCEPLDVTHDPQPHSSSTIRLSNMSQKSCTNLKEYHPIILTILSEPSGTSLIATGYLLSLLMTTYCSPMALIERTDLICRQFLPVIIWLLQPRA